MGSSSHNDSIIATFLSGAGFSSTTPFPKVQSLGLKVEGLRFIEFRALKSQTISPKPKKSRLFFHDSEMPELEGRSPLWGRIPAVRRALREPGVNAVPYLDEC